MKPGIYPDITHEAYHADPCDKPSLSASLSKILLARSPLHAWCAHPRLNPDYEHEEKAVFDVGTAAHEAVLQGIDRMVIVVADDWRTKAAKEARDQARAAGKIPVLTKHGDAIYAMTDALTAAMANCPDLNGITLADGKAEQTLIWQDGKVTCRSRLDWLASDHSLILDYKTTNASANPVDWTRTGLLNLGGDLQAAFYLRGLKALTGKDAKFIFMVQEVEPPHAVSFIGMPPAFLDLGEAKVADAIDLFGLCQESDTWPGYSNRVCWADPPAWAQANYMERAAHAAVGFEVDPVQQREGLQA